MTQHYSFSTTGASTAASAATPTDPAARYRAQRHFGSLDGLRALSILLVLWHHSDVRIDGLAITARGFLGVDVFFVLSGYLIVTLLLRESEVSGTISLRDFYLRRTLRIFPLYYAILAVMFVGWLLQPDSVAMANYRAGLPYYATYTSNFLGPSDTAFAGGLLGLTWTLSTEEQFYLVWPAVQRHLRRWAIPALLAFLVANLAVMFGFVLAEYRPTHGIAQATFAPIGFGVLLAYALHHRHDLVHRLLGARWAAPVCLALFLVVLNLPNGTDEPGWVVGWLRLASHIVIVGLVASVVVREDHGLAAVLRFRPLARLGVVSYGVYLLHLLVRHVVVALGVPAASVALFVAMTLATWLVAEVSFRFFESPILRLKKRFERPKHRPDDAAGYRVEASR